MGLQANDMSSREKEINTNFQKPTSSAGEFREGGYGWVCVVCTFLMNAHTWGINAVRLQIISFSVTLDWQGLIV